MTTLRNLQRVPGYARAARGNTGTGCALARRENDFIQITAMSDRSHIVVRVKGTQAAAVASTRRAWDMATLRDCEYLTSRYEVGWGSSGEVMPGRLAVSHAVFVPALDCT